jgi:hypothetical protein
MNVDAAVPYSGRVGGRDPLAILARAGPDRGARSRLSVDWIIRVLAGHDLHHIEHLSTIAGR